MAIVSFCVGSVSIVFGFAAGFLKHLEVAQIFGGCLLPVWVLFFMSGYTVEAFKSSAGLAPETFCDANKMPELVFEYVNGVDKEFRNMASKWMCSRQCPCDMKQVMPWLAKSEEELRKWDRTKNLLDKDDNDGSVLILATTFTGADTDYFPGSFEQCFTDWKQDWNTFGRQANKTPVQWWPAAQRDFEALAKNEITFVFGEYIESKYNCAGMCRDAFFYVTKEVGEGIPTKTCLADIQKEMQAAIPLRFWLLVTAFSTLALWIS